MYVCALWVVSLTLSCVALRVCSRGPGREPQVGEPEAAGEHPGPRQPEAVSSKEQDWPKAG